MKNQGNRNNVLYVVFYELSDDQSYFLNKRTCKKNVLTETYKKNWAGQHSELLNWISNGQFKSKMNLPLEKVSKIPLGALTIGVTIQINDETEEFTFTDHLLLAS